MMKLQIKANREDCISLDSNLVVVLLLPPYRRRRAGAYELSFIQRVSAAVVVVACCDVLRSVSREVLSRMYKT